MASGASHFWLLAAVYGVALVRLVPLI